MTSAEQETATPDGIVRAVIFGRQGSGKGTQSALLVLDFGCAHISTGDMLRAAIAAGTELGLQAKVIMDDGGLVPDDVMIGIVAERLAERDALEGGFLLDGFPRTPGQAEALDKILIDLGVQLHLAINLDVPVEEVTSRMLERGRVDDTPEAIARRLDLYEDQTAPLFEWFSDQGLLEVVDGRGSETEVAARIRSVIMDRLVPPTEGA